jgi:WD40 repeat protein
MRVLGGNAKSVLSLAFSPDGRILAAGCCDRNVRLWDLATGQVQATLKGPRTYVHRLVYSPDGQVLGCAAGDLLLWHLAAGKSARSNKEQVQIIGDVAFALDGQTLATASRELGGANTVLAGAAHLWDAGVHVAALTGPAAPTRRGAWMAMLPPERERTTAVEKYLTENGGREGYHVWSVAFAPDGRTLALGTDRGGVVLWDRTSGETPRRLPVQAAVKAMAFTADGGLLAALDGSRVRVWEPATGRTVSTLRGHQRRVTCLAFAPGGASGRAPWLLTGSEDETVRCWGATAAQERAAFRWPLGKVRAVAFAPDGMTAAASGDNGDIVIWDVEEA